MNYFYEYDDDGAVDLLLVLLHPPGVVVLYAAAGGVRMSVDHPARPAAAAEDARCSHCSKLNFRPGSTNAMESECGGGLSARRVDENRQDRTSYIIY